MSVSKRNLSLGVLGVALLFGVVGCSSDEASAKDVSNKTSKTFESDDFESAKEFIKSKNSIKESLHESKEESDDYN